MNLRICPSCHMHLCASDYYFCSACGGVLPSNVVEAPQGVSHVSFYQEVGKDPFWECLKRASHILNLKSVLLSVILVIFGIALFFIWNQKLYKVVTGGRTTGNTVGNNAQPVIPQAAQATTDYASYIPFEADAVMLFANYETAVPFGYALAKEHFAAIEGLTKEKDQPVALFIVIKDKVPGTTVLFTSKTDLALTDKQKLETDDHLFIEKVEDVIIVSNQQSSVKAVIESRSHTSKNIALNPKYVLMLGELGKFGVATAFTFTQEGAIYVGTFTTMSDVPLEVQGLLDRLIKSGKNYAIQN